MVDGAIFWIIVLSMGIVYVSEKYEDMMRPRYCPRCLAENNIIRPDLITTRRDDGKYIAFAKCPKCGLATSTYASIFMVLAKYNAVRDWNGDLPLPFKLAALVEVEEEFVLEKTDKFFGLDPSEEPTRITVRHATRQANEYRERSRERIFNTIYWRDKWDNISFSHEWTMKELRKVEAFLTLVSCNILDEYGKPLFRFKKHGNSHMLDMSEGEFIVAWGKLPPIVAHEISEYVRKVNRAWAPQGNRGSRTTW